MAFLDLKITLTDGKRVRMSDRTNRSSRDCKQKKYVQYIHDECPDDTIPITSVANILAKLAGKRPWKRSDIEAGKVPSYFYRFIEMANTTFVNIVTPSDNKEIIRSKKPSHSPTKDAWELSLDGNLFSMGRKKPTYETIRATLSEVDWQNFDDMLTKVFGSDYRSNAESRAATATSMITSLRDEYVQGNQDVIEFCEAYKDTKTKLRDLVIIPLTKGSPVRDGDSYKVFRIDDPIGNRQIDRAIHTKTNTHGIIMMQVVSGVLHVKVNETELDMFRNGPGFVTFLDGGVAEIETLDLDYWQHETDNLPHPFTGQIQHQE